MNNPERETPLRERSVPEISEALQQVLGQHLVAYAIFERSPKKIRMYAQGEETPTGAVEETLRDLAEVTEVLLQEEDGSAELVKALMLGRNPRLHDRAAIELFREGEGAVVVEAGRALARADYS